MFDPGDELIARRTDDATKDVVTQVCRKSMRAPADDAALGLLVHAANIWHALSQIARVRPQGAHGERFDNPAGILLRALQDACLQLDYVCAGDDSLDLSPNDLGRLYFDYEHVERRKMTTAIERIDNPFTRKLKQSPLREEGNAQAEERYRAVKDEYSSGPRNRVRNTWYPDNMASIAKKVGRSDEYFFFFQSFNTSVHGGPMAVRHGPYIKANSTLTLATNLLTRALAQTTNLTKVEVSASTQEVLDSDSDILRDPGISD